MKRLVVAGGFGLLLCLSVSAGETDVPHTLTELNRWYVEPPTNQNAAIPLQQGFAALNIYSNDYRSEDYLPWISQTEIPVPGAPISASMNSALSNLLARNQTALAFFDAAAHFERCRFPLDFTDGDHALSTLARSLEGLHRATALLNLKALGLFSTGHGVEAADLLTTNLMLARFGESIPDLNSQMWCCSFIESTVENLEQLLNRVALPVDTLARLQSVFNNLEDAESAGVGFTRGLIGWRVINDCTITNTAKRQFIVETFDQALAAWKKPLPDRIDSLNAIVHKRQITAEQVGLTNGVLLITVSPARRDATCVASLRLAQTAIALERYRTIHFGVYPNRLADLKSDFLEHIPEDPFDGAPLRYHRTTRGYFMYSVGRDSQDNGGMRRKLGETSDGTDITFAVVRGPKP